MKFISVGEILVRFSPQNYEKIVQASAFNVNYGGAEVNVAVSLVNLGVDTSVFSVVPDNSLADAALKYLKSNGIDTRHIKRSGERLGTYYLEEGVSIRPSEVIYDRKHSSICEVDPDSIDYEQLLQGFDWLHISGITPALSENCRILTERILKSAKALGITVSFDPNFRGKLWSFDTSRDVLSEYMQYVDILVGIEPIHLKDENGKELKDGLSMNPDINTMDTIFRKLNEKYKFKAIARTVREVHSSTNNSLKAYLHIGDKTYESKKINFDIVDRVGGGDAFTAGLIYGLMKNFEPQKTIDFAIASSAIKHTIRGDANLSSKKQIDSFMTRGFEIKR
ncbi:sugar kinase [Clostridium sp. YIM B02515]|uniref:Sugar kinase n=1 Tax=Clostridium rhizosphaerae TaxID=2803861 RepID=A0ABS1TCS1_9CLOT|nr:sugar kinase [Clostridium rhizosphaerae]MBL4937149.1 sugar kinase [Clostridium rhizosphaerae]